MPLRPWDREQAWLFPPTLDELLAADHPARFVAAFVDALESATWAELGIMPEGEPLGAPAYHPRALLCVWLYGFMTGVRSSRKLEMACRDQVPYWWLTGRQRPDHNTLWRFYQGHRQQMRQLLKGTVGIAMRLGLVDLAVQAVDGTKVAGNAAKDRSYDEAGLQRLLDRTEATIAELEAQNEGGDDPPPPRLPQQLAQQEELRAQVQAALKGMTEEAAPLRVNLTDPEAVLMKGRQGFVAGYNAQAMVSPLKASTAGERGLLITAAEVVSDPEDHAQLAPMLEAAQENTGQRGELTLADGGYLSGENLAVCQQREQAVAMPADPLPPYHKESFTYDAATDSYQCPEGQLLTLSHRKQQAGRRRHPVRVYRASGAVCRVCPLFGQCTKDRQGRSLEVGPYDGQLQQHRAWMAQDTIKEAYRQRKELVEPAFGILKEQQGARRFLLRGLAKVRAEWSLLATAFNLRTLCRVWVAAPQRWALAGS